jgi:hypothetical protein
MKMSFNSKPKRNKGKKIGLVEKSMKTKELNQLIEDEDDEDEDD